MATSFSLTEGLQGATRQAASQQDPRDFEPLPPLRQELRLEAAPAARDGSRRWHLFDPLNNRFFIVSELDVQLLRYFGDMTRDSVIRALENEGYDDARNRLQSLEEFLVDNGLLVDHRPAEPTPVSPAVYIPLWDPKPFLAPFASWHKRQWRVYMLGWKILTLVALLLISEQWQEFLDTFSYFFNWLGLLAYLLALVVLKLVHELGHALAAMRSGAPPGKIGVAFIFGFPMAYTELDGVARIRSRRKRMMVAAGGVYAETMVAGMALLAWAVLPDGVMRSLAFVLATTSLATSLLINMNPLSRFDGYYFLADWWGKENLQTRSLELLRWRVASLFLGHKAMASVPEAADDPDKRWMLLYGCGVWLYLMLVMSSLGYLIYEFIAVWLGLLAWGAIAVKFLIMPLARLTGSGWQQRRAMSIRRKVILLGLFGAFLAGIFMPLDDRLVAPAVARYELQHRFLVPHDSRVTSLRVANGEWVEAGQLLLTLESPELEHQLRTARLDGELIRRRMHRASATDLDRVEWQVLNEQIQQASVEIDAIQNQMRALRVVATAAGRVENLPLQLKPGDWLAKDSELLEIKNPAVVEVLAYVPENYMSRLRDGVEGLFIANDPELPPLAASLQQVDAAAVESLAELQLSSNFGGPVAAYQNADGAQVPVQALHIGRLTSAGSDWPADLSLTGKINIQVDAVSVWQRVARHVWSILLTDLEG